MGPSSLSSPFLSPDSVDRRAFGEGEGTQGPLRMRHSAVHSRMPGLNEQVLSRMLLNLPGQMLLY